MVVLVIVCIAALCVAAALAMRERGAAAAARLRLAEAQTEAEDGLATREALSEELRRPSKRAGSAHENKSEVVEAASDRRLAASR